MEAREQRRRARAIEAVIVIEDAQLKRKSSVPNPIFAPAPTLARKRSATLMRSSRIDAARPMSSSKAYGNGTYFLFAPYRLQSTEETHLPDAHQPQPPESAVRPDARTDASGDGIAAPIPPSSPRFNVREVFVGPDGLRAGWALLLYFVLLAALMAGGIFLVNPPHHHAAPAQPNAAAQFAPQSSQSSAPVFLPPKAILLGDGMTSLSVLIAAWLMAKIERRPTSAYGLGGRRRLPNFLSGLAWGVAAALSSGLHSAACGLLAFDARLLWRERAALRRGLVRRFSTGRTL